MGGKERLEAEKCSQLGRDSKPGSGHGRKLRFTASSSKRIHEVKVLSLGLCKKDMVVVVVVFLGVPNWAPHKHIFLAHRATVGMPASTSSRSRVPGELPEDAYARQHRCLHSPPHSMVRRAS